MPEHTFRLMLHTFGSQSFPAGRFASDAEAREVGLWWAANTRFTFYVQPLDRGVWSKFITD